MHPCFPNVSSQESNFLNAASVAYKAYINRQEESPDPTAGDLLKRLSDLENYPDDALAPYEEYKLDGKTYYFTPGGFLYRKDPGTDIVGGFFCGYLTDEVWHYRTDDG